MDKSPLPESRWLSVKAAAHYVGVSVFTMYRAIKARKVDHSRFGRRVLVDRLKLDALLNSGGISPQEPKSC